MDVYICFHTDMKLEECKVDEKEIMKIATEVGVAKREAEIVSTGVCYSDTCRNCSQICHVLNIFTRTWFDHVSCPWLQRLDEQDFGEQKEINKRKRLILEGKVSY